jgi:hypothetical protein
MSLINDALKQARQPQSNNPPSGSPPPLPPVESPPRGGINWFLLTLIVLLLVAAGFLFGLSLSKSTSLSPTNVAKRSHPRQIEVVSNSLPVVTNAPSGSNAVIAVPPPPEPKLQGILFAPTRPSAIVDGRTVFVGGHVSGFRVTAISKNDVTLENGTKTKVLRLGR